MPSTARTTPVAAASTPSTPLSSDTAPRTPSTPRSSSSGHAKQEAIPWQVHFGFWNELDVAYNAFPTPLKPRVPSLQLDSAAEWVKRMVPTSPEAFFGNPTAMQCLHMLESGDTNPLTNFIISGGECTGKRSFIGLLKRALLNSGFDPPCAFGSVNAKHFGEKDLLLKIEDFVRRVDPHKIKAAFLVVEHFEVMTPSAQQHLLLPVLQDANAKSVFCVFHVRPDLSKVAEQIKQRALRVHLQPLKPMQVRTKLLRICSQERIGFTRDGLEELLTRGDFKLLACMDALRRVFLRDYYVSLPNVRKPAAWCEPSSPSPPSSLSGTSSSSKHSKRTAAKSPAQRLVAAQSPPFPLSIIEMSAPLRRCTKCTLLPPCSHVSIVTLFDRLERVRSLYPRQSDDSDSDSNSNSDEQTESTAGVCSSFLATGVCRNIQALGRCCYAHPLALHTIDTSAIVKRCRVHTLPLPCVHCTNVSAMRDSLRREIAACIALEAQLRTARKQLADLDVTRLLFVRDRAKRVKWGTAKREFDDTLARYDAELVRLRREIDALTSDLATTQARRDQLERDNERGTSHGTLSQTRSA